MNDFCKEINNFLKRLFPICRSLTGEGNRETLSILKEIIPLKIHEVPSGTKIFDWEIPLEWRIREAWIKDKKGQILIDFSKNNLHVLGYSHSVKGKISFDELKNHLHFLPNQPDAIPYLASYYESDWGFCLSNNQYAELFGDAEEYEVCIDADLFNGNLSYGEYYIRGESEQEILLSSYICHPSLANDNLSGIILSALLGRELAKSKTYFSYRFVFAPETIGALAFCARAGHAIKNIIGGYVLTCLGGPGKFGYKQSFAGNHLIDRVAVHAFMEKRIEYHHYPFMPKGSDERQYSSPGFRIPIGSIYKDKFSEFENYHTSKDNLDFVKAEYMEESFRLYAGIIKNLEASFNYYSLFPFGEPQLGKRGLYPRFTQREMPKDSANHSDLDLIRWILFYGDGSKSLFEIAELLQEPIDRFSTTYSLLEKKGLVKKKQ
jgi:aminopeptidase-like protein